MEIGADVLLKATKVDGVYDKDPALFPDAVKYQELTYMDVLERQLRVMDATAVSSVWTTNSLSRSSPSKSTGT